MTRYLITGGRGMLGSDLATALAGRDVTLSAAASLTSPIARQFGASSTASTLSSTRPHTRRLTRQKNTRQTLPS